MISSSYGNDVYLASPYSPLIIFYTKYFDCPTNRPHQSTAQLSLTATNTEICRKSQLLPLLLCESLAESDCLGENLESPLPSNDEQLNTNPIWSTPAPIRHDRKPKY